MGLLTGVHGCSRYNRCVYRLVFRDWERYVASCRTQVWARRDLTTVSVGAAVCLLSVAIIIVTVLSRLAHHIGSRIRSSMTALIIQVGCGRV